MYWQIETAGGPAPRRAFHGDEAPGLLHGTVHLRQPEPHTLPGSFVVKNGSKMRATTSRAIPVPVSLTDSLEYDPRRAFAQVVLDASAPVNLHFSPRRQVARTSDDIPDDDDRAGAQECGGGAP